MKTITFFLATLLSSTAFANAEPIATWKTELPSSDLVTVQFTETVSTHPYCKGRLEATATLTTGGIERPYGRGCWEPSLPYRKAVSVTLYSYSDGREMAFPVKADQIVEDRAAPGRMSIFLTPAQQELDAYAKHGRVISADELPKATKPIFREVVGTARLFGPCDVFHDLSASAETSQEKTVVDGFRAQIAREKNIAPAEVDKACSG